MADKLKPCPFCGGRAKFVSVFWGTGEVATRHINCTNCASRGPYRRDEAEAIAAWNRRATPEPSEAEVEAVATVFHGALGLRFSINEVDSRSVARAAIAALRAAKEKEHG